MAYHIKPLFVTGFLALVLSGCSPSSRFAQLATPFAPVAFVDENQDDLAVAEVHSETEETLPILSYAPVAKAADPARAEIDRLIEKYAALYNVPASLVHHVVRRESTYRPGARNGIHIGLMQLNPQTARTMGYSGTNAGLYDAETNLKYGVKYLAGAYLVADGDAMRADRLYQSGYYYHAKHKGLLKETGLRG